MSLLAISVDQITEADLKALVASAVPESKVLEYKRDAIGGSDRDRNEFLADISSFANTSGGDLLIGIAESGGVPAEICGIDVPDVDQEILRLEQMVRTGMRPTIGGIVARAISVSDDKSVIVMRIPKSWAGPHQVGQLGSFRFFGRGSNGKYQLDVDALRSAFRQGPEIAERIRQFRAERLGKIISNDSPISVSEKSKIAVHIVPLNNFATRAPIDLSAIRKSQNILSSLLQSGGISRINLDGLFSFSRRSDTDAHSYVQLFRDATIEIVQGVPDWEVRGNNFLPGEHFDEIIQQIMKGTKAVYEKLEIQPPIAVLLTLLGMENRKMGSGKQYGYDSDPTFGRSEIVCPDVLLESLDNTPEELAFPIVNLAWNAAGYDKSVFYNENGKRKAG